MRSEEDLDGQTVEHSPGGYATMIREDIRHREVVLFACGICIREGFRVACNNSCESRRLPNVVVAHLFP